MSTISTYICSKLEVPFEDLQFTSLEIIRSGKKRIFATPVSHFKGSDLRIIYEKSAVRPTHIVAQAAGVKSSRITPASLCKGVADGMSPRKRGNVKTTLIAMTTANSKDNEKFLAYAATMVDALRTKAENRKTAIELMHLSPDLPELKPFADTLTKLFNIVDNFEDAVKKADNPDVKHKVEQALASVIYDGLLALRDEQSDIVAQSEPVKGRQRSVSDLVAEGAEMLQGSALSQLRAATDVADRVKEVTPKFESTLSNIDDLVARGRPVLEYASKVASFFQEMTIARLLLTVTVVVLVGAGGYMLASMVKTLLGTLLGWVFPPKDFKEVHSAFNDIPSDEDVVAQSFDIQHFSVLATGLMVATFMYKETPDLRKNALHYISRVVNFKNLQGNVEGMTTFLVSVYDAIVSFALKPLGIDLTIGTDPKKHYDELVRDASAYLQTAARKCGRYPISAQQLGSYAMDLDSLAKTRELPPAHMAKLRELALKCLSMKEKVEAECPEGTYRPVPVCLVVRGSAGIGKTRFVQALTSSLAEYVGEVENRDTTNDEVWTPVHGSQFDEGYNGQVCCVLDDIWYMNANADNEGFLDGVHRVMRLVNEYPSQMHMPDVDSKGKVMFTSRFVLGTTNAQKIDTDRFQGAGENILRRLHYVVEAEVKDDYKFPSGAVNFAKVEKDCEHDPCPHLRFKLCKDFNTPGDKVVDYDGLLDLIIEAYQSHQRKFEAANDTISVAKASALKRIPKFYADGTWTQEGAARISAMKCSCPVCRPHKPSIAKLAMDFFSESEMPATMALAASADKPFQSKAISGLTCLRALGKDQSDAYKLDVLRFAMDMNTRNITKEYGTFFDSMRQISKDTMAYIKRHSWVFSGGLLTLGIGFVYAIFHTKTGSRARSFMSGLYSTPREDAIVAESGDVRRKKRPIVAQAEILRAREINPVTTFTESLMRSSMYHIVCATPDLETSFVFRAFGLDREAILIQRHFLPSIMEVLNADPRATMTVGVALDLEHKTRPIYSIMLKDIRWRKGWQTVELFPGSEVMLLHLPGFTTKKRTGNRSPFPDTITDGRGLGYLAANLRGVASATFAAEWEYYGDNVGPQISPKGHYIRYDLRTECGACGVPFVAAIGKSRPYVLGFHVAGDTKHLGFSAMVTSKQADNAYKVLCDTFDVPIYQQLEDTPDMTPFIKEVVDGERLEGRDVIAITDRPVVSPQSTKLQRTPIADFVPFDLSMAPAMLRRMDNVDPVANAREGYGQHMIIPDRECLEAAFISYTESLFNRSKKPVHNMDNPVTMETAIKGTDDINSINVSTGPGIPSRWRSTKQGKLEYFDLSADDVLSCPLSKELRTRVENMIEFAKTGVPLTVFQDFCKDELRSLEKVAAGATRGISGSDLAYTISVRMYFLPVMQWYVENRVLNGSGVGVNPFNEWGTIPRILKAHEEGRFIEAGDYKAFDKRLCPLAFDFFARICDRFYQDAGSQESDIRRNLLKAASQSVHITGDVLYQWNGSNPSGNPLTTFVNNTWNELCKRYGVIKTVKRTADFHEFMALAFEVEKNIITVVFGDDGLMSIRPEGILAGFTQEAFAEAIAEIGMVYTNEAKDGFSPLRKIEDVTFLKRGFRYDDGAWYAPLDLKSIFKPLIWSRSSHVEWKETVAHSFIELAGHGKEVYETWTKKLAPAMKLIDGFWMPDFRSARAQYYHVARWY